MSASLVGSEMCIRDSLPGRNSGRKSASYVKFAVWRPSPKEVHRSTTVSYTHLTLPTICSV
eukprot:3274179-Alexandrium_andersonii.AAC.1